MSGSQGLQIPRLHIEYPLRGARFVLAVSGGLDSMVLLDAMALAAREPAAELLVATFDHGTGPAAREAVELVRETARERGISFVAGAAGSGDVTAASEEAWRDARWRFLRRVAREFEDAAGCEAAICTAHTRNDQVETVLMRALRDAGARGLAGLAAPSPIVRPLLGVARDQIASYALERRLRWMEDPSNASTRYLRNRMRREVLPVLGRVAPGFEDELFAIGNAAGEWRRDLDAFVGQAVEIRQHPRGLDAARADLAAYPRESIAMLWAAVAARAGLVLDRRGAVRATDFILGGRVGGTIQFSGNWQLRCTRHWFELRKSAAIRPDRANPAGPAGVKKRVAGANLH